MANIGEKISFNRKSKGMTQEELAEKLGVSGQAVSKWENNLACPDIQLLVPLSKIFSITCDELLSNDSLKEVIFLSEDDRLDIKDLTLKVFIDSKDGDKVRINLPMQLVKIALEIGSKIPQIAYNKYLNNINFDEIILLVESGVIGKLVEVDGSDGDIINVIVE